MSDIRAQSRRDAEFDRLLSERACANPSKAKYTEEDMQAAHEMGKRHGREMDQEERRGSTKLPADEVKPL